MKLDDWLAQRSQSCPDRTALVADGAEMTYAELEAEATWVARRLAAHGVRRGSTAALTMHPRREQVVLAARADEARRHAAAAEPAADRGRAGGDRRRRGADRRPRRPRRADPDRGRHAAARRARHGRRLRPGPDQRQHRRPAPGRRSPTATSSGARSAPPSTSASSPTDRWLCCLPLSHISGLGIVMRSVIYGTTAVVHDGFDVDRVGAALEDDGITVSLAGGDDADPAARGRRRPLRPAGDPGRRRPGAGGAAGRGDRQGRHRRPDLRPDRDLLAGDDAGPGRRPAQARLRRPAAADHPPADPGRRDPRPGPDRRPRPRRRRRLAAHRRPRPHRRGGLPLRQGPDRRHDRQRRRERRPGRGRGGAAAPPARSPTPPWSAARTRSGSRR